MNRIDRLRIAGELEEPARIPNDKDRAQHLLPDCRCGRARFCNQRWIDQLRLGDCVTGDLLSRPAAAKRDKECNVGWDQAAQAAAGPPNGPRWAGARCASWSHPART